MTKFFYFVFAIISYFFIKRLFKSYMRNRQMNNNEKVFHNSQKSGKSPKENRDIVDVEYKEIK